MVAPNHKYASSPLAHKGLYPGVHVQARSSLYWTLFWHHPHSIPALLFPFLGFSTSF